ncbi:MAG TPA: hypothetical protein VKS21_01220, partial [Spirochaetota bacterium]|nr:hypothetical protein [Spirochaetota bacterium]
MKKSIVAIYLEYWPALFIFKIFRILPAFLGKGLGKLITFFIYFLVGSARRVTRINLGIAFPGYSKTARKTVIKGFYKHLGVTLYEFIMQS